MPSSNRASSNDSRNLVILLMVVIGGFLAFCGLGMSSPLVIALGVIVALAGPVMIAVVNNRNKVRLYVQGTAIVEEITARPTQEGRSARGRLKLTITATGIRGVTVTGTDPAIPIEKWPERGATLPVQVLKGTPRKFTVLWERVQTHQEVVLAEQRRPADDLEHDYAALNAQLDKARQDIYDPDEPFRRPSTYLPPDNSTTLTDLPPVKAETADARVATVAPPDPGGGEQIPDAATGRPSLRGYFGFPNRQSKPRHAAGGGNPAHRTDEPMGAAPTATDPGRITDTKAATGAEPPAAAPVAGTEPAAAAAGAEAEPTAAPRVTAAPVAGTEPAAAATGAEAEPTAAPRVTAAPVAGTEPAAAAPIVEAEPTAAEPVAGTEPAATAPIVGPETGAAEPKTEPATDPKAEREAVEESPAAESWPEPTETRPTVIGEEDEPIIMRLRSTPRPGGSQHRRPSPHPRSGAHDRVRRSRPGRTRPVTPEPPALPEALAATQAEPTPAITDPQAEPPTAATHAQDEPPTAATDAQDEATTATTDTQGEPQPALDPRTGPLWAENIHTENAHTENIHIENVGTENPYAENVRAETVDAEAETATEHSQAEPGVYTIPESGSMVPAPQADPESGAEIEWWTSADEPRPAAAYYPDRESELPPTRGMHTEPPVIEGELADSEADSEPEADSRSGADSPSEADSRSEVHSEPEAVSEAAADAREERTGSAWSVNGKGLYGAPPLLRSPADEDDDEEPVSPDPYASEHYLPADDRGNGSNHSHHSSHSNRTDEDGDDADALEEQPLSEGAVAEFLAAGPRRQQATPLDGVNGVSITLIVSDLQRSRRFYRDTLGLTELDSGETSAVLETGTARVVLRRVADMPPVDRRVVHLNLDVPDVYDAYERLREQGVDFVHRPRTVPQGEQLELCSATFRDPDGHAIALTRWELRR
ncbi:VOC family protein [Dactylosporangium sp. CA-052675]|uniref:VOC family protein n=1 Tax=Dactylosporangium sp. CA-052675 TaxID=3239927 RepID=UPI003D8B6555